ncbi:DUF2828 family protein, partial [Methanoculleus sp.]|uniref:DUF2828 family protein n=1 Tax=Methanoculleus sp. TaxID=90427 RepID=UPI0025EB8F88
MKNINNIKLPKSSIKKTSKFIDEMYAETSIGETENGAVTYTRTASPLLDFYAQSGSMRNEKEEALNLFKRAFSEDREKAVRILFYLRDVRGGQGERALFRICLEWLGNTYEDIFEKVVEYVSEYGRWDDMFFDNKKCFSIIKKQIISDETSEIPSLLAKWMPTINASSPTTRAKALFMADKLGFKEIDYRKKIRSIRKKIKIVEEKMSANKWEKIDYSSVPSQASKRYKNAFKKHDEERYSAFIDKAEKGEEKINAGTLYPYQIYKTAQSDYSKTLEALWKQLPDYTQGKNALVVADTSGSMTGDPMSVSVSLALYFAERNKGQFKDYFISFSERPKLHKIQGKTLLDKMNSIELGDVANTNLEAVFRLILNTAVRNNTSKEEMPETIYIISDMEFDYCSSGKTNLEAVREMYEIAGYKIPNIVFWNVNSSGKNLPAQNNEYGVALVSGFSPVVFKIAVENKTPEQIMLDTIN